MIMTPTQNRKEAAGKRRLQSNAYPQPIDVPNVITSKFVISSLIIKANTTGYRAPMTLNCMFETSKVVVRMKREHCFLSWF